MGLLHGGGRRRALRWHWHHVGGKGQGLVGGLLLDLRVDHPLVGLPRLPRARGLSSDGGQPEDACQLGGLLDHAKAWLAAPRGSSGILFVGSPARRGCTSCGSCSQGPPPPCVTCGTIDSRGLAPRTLCAFA